MKTAALLLLLAAAVPASAQIPYIWLCDSQGRSVGLLVDIPSPGVHQLLFADVERQYCPDRAPKGKKGKPEPPPRPAPPALPPARSV